jgi:HNH endonuclease
MHLDENAANNRASNLQWGTQKENLNADGFTAYCRSRTGDNNPLIKGRRNKAHATPRGPAD